MPIIQQDFKSAAKKFCTRAVLPILLSLSLSGCTLYNIASSMSPSPNSSPKAGTAAYYAKHVESFKGNDFIDKDGWKYRIYPNSKAMNDQNIPFVVSATSPDNRGAQLAKYKNNIWGVYTGLGNHRSAIAYFKGNYPNERLEFISGSISDFSKIYSYFDYDNLRTYIGDPGSNKRKYPDGPEESTLIKNSQEYKTVLQAINHLIPQIEKASSNHIHTSPPENKVKTDVCLMHSTSLIKRKDHITRADFTKKGVSVTVIIPTSDPKGNDQTFSFSLNKKQDCWYWVGDFIDISTVIEKQLNELTAFKNLSEGTKRAAADAITASAVEDLPWLSVNALEVIPRILNKQNNTVPISTFFIKKNGQDNQATKLNGITPIVEHRL